ncbi:MAG: disulfide isomerase DsbC N-terminal domain-containing protein, partial [Thermodesulfovibrionales bacterium]|nr:disulfide isomerase DsbC N-terminal domain-containing protein [Thermodesulfovibrionales bacterium]
HDSTEEASVTMLNDLTRLYYSVMRKYILLIFVLFAASVLNVPLSYGSSNADHDCTKYHKLTSNEAQNILQGGIPASKVLEINPGPVKGVWEIVFEVRGQKGIVYIGLSKELLISGDIFDLKARRNLTGERISILNRIDVSQIPLGGAIVMGDKNAPKKVIVFTDPD